MAACLMKQPNQFWEDPASYCGGKDVVKPTAAAAAHDKAMAFLNDYSH